DDDDDDHTIEHFETF
nr:RecName: Full=Unknown protein 2 [Ichthyophis tricolor]